MRRRYLAAFVLIVLIAGSLGAAQSLHFIWRGGYTGLGQVMPFTDLPRYHAGLLYGRVRAQLLSSDKAGLPPVRLYVSEQSQRRLMEDLPENVKEWQRGHMVYPDGNIRRMQIRHRGDNPANWIGKKKSWRMKTRKKHIIDGVRRFNFPAPQEADFIRNHLAYRLGEMVGIPSPSSRLVELFINDQPHGIYAEVEDISESFLRNRNVMPVNIYKGEQYNSERLIYTTNYLFNSPGAWTKRAIFNRRDPDDAFDLIAFFEALLDAESSAAALDDLVRIAPFDAWARFAAYQVLVRSRHNSDVHNQRLIGDPWRGVVLPVVHDTVMSVPAEINIAALEGDSNQPLDLFSRVSDFTAAKYDFLWSFLQNRVLSSLAAEIEQSIPSMLASYSRDPYTSETALMTTGRWLPDSVDDMADLWTSMAERLRAWEAALIEALTEGPDVTWYTEDGQFAVTVDGAVPTGYLRLATAFSDGRPSVLAWDRDGNGVLSNGDVSLPFSLETDGIVVEASFTANRISSASTRVANDISAGDFTLVPTTFTLVSDAPMNPESVSVSNLFTGADALVPNVDQRGMSPTVYNAPVAEDRDVAPELWSGRIEIDADRIVDWPVIIQAGTEIAIAPGRNLTFRGHVQADGTRLAPVRVVPLDANAGAWGAFSLAGPKTAGSVLRNIHAEGGSEGVSAGVYFSGMVNLHDSRDIVVDGLVAKRNKVSDDLVHIIYVDNYVLENCRLLEARSDAVDIDVSYGVIRNCVIEDSGNDALDFMASKALVSDVDLSGSGDKGVSVGEGSEILIRESRLTENYIGVESRDGSRAFIVSSDLLDNTRHFNAYLKNWRYGDSGHGLAFDSRFAGPGEFATASNGSSFVVMGSTVERRPDTLSDGVFVDPPSLPSGMPNLHSELENVLQRWDIDAKPVE